MSRTRRLSREEMEAPLEALAPQDGLIPSATGYGPAAPDLGSGLLSDLDSAARSETEREASRDPEIRDRERAMQRSLAALEREDEEQGPLIDDGEPSVQLARGVDRPAYRRGQHQAFAEEASENPATAALLSIADAYAIPRSIIASAGGSRAGNQHEMDRMMEDSPWASAGGTLLAAAPLMMGAPALAAGNEALLARALGVAPETLTAGARIGLGMGEAGFGAAMHEQAADREFGSEILPAMGLAGLMGAGSEALQGVMRWAGGDDLPRTLTGRPDPGAEYSDAADDTSWHDAFTTRAPRSPIDRLEEKAKLLRQRSRGLRTVGVMRQAARMEGGNGIDALDEWTNEALGPQRYQINSVDENRDLFDILHEQAGNRIGRVVDMMGRADEADAQRFAGEQALVDERRALRDLALQAIESDDPSDLILSGPQGSPQNNIGAELLRERLARNHQNLRDDFADAVMAPEETMRRAGIDGDATDDLAGLLEPEAVPIDADATGAGSPAAAARQGAARQERLAIDHEARSNANARRDLRPQDDLVRAFDNDELTAIFRSSDFVNRGEDGVYRRAAPPPRDMVPVENMEPRALGRTPTPEAAARLRAMLDAELPEMEAPRPAGTVQLQPIADELEAIAQNHESYPAGRRLARTARSAASEYSDGAMPFGQPATGGRPGTGAFGQRQAVERDINYSRGNATAMPRRRALSERDLIAERQAIQEAMDRAVSAVDPEAGAAYPGMRRDFQFSGILGRLGEDNELREASNRVMGMSDYLASSPDDGIVMRILKGIGNNWSRGREASAAATGLELTSDALQSPRTGAAADVLRLLRGNADEMVGELRRPEALEQPEFSADELVGMIDESGGEIGDAVDDMPIGDGMDAAPEEGAEPFDIGELGLSPEDMEAFERAMEEGQ